MQEMQLQAIYPKSKNNRTEVTRVIYPYLLDKIEIFRPNQVFAADITYIKMHTGFMYLFAVMDLFSRYIISWDLSNTLDASFCIEVAKESCKISRPEIFNTDQGVQFTSKDWCNTLRDFDIKISMTGKGRCIDNVFIERFWRTIKYEDIYLYGYKKVSDLYSGIEKFIKFYNYKRMHQSLNYKTPSELYNEKQ